MRQVLYMFNSCCYQPLIFFPKVFWGENFTADLSDLPTFRCSLCAALDFSKLYAGTLAPLALSGCQHLLFPCPCRPLRWPALWTDQWILLQTLDCASHLSMCRLKRTSKIMQNPFNSIPNQSLISILHIVCYWQDSVGCINSIFCPMLPPTICLHLKEAQLLPFASSWEASWSRVASCQALSRHAH